MHSEWRNNYKQTGIRCVTLSEKAQKLLRKTKGSSSCSDIYKVYQHERH